MTEFRSVLLPLAVLHAVCLGLGVAALLVRTSARADAGCEGSVAAFLALLGTVELLRALCPIWMVLEFVGCYSSLGTADCAGTTASFAECSFISLVGGAGRWRWSVAAATPSVWPFPAPPLHLHVCTRSHLHLSEPGTAAPPHVCRPRRLRRSERCCGARRWCFRRRAGRAQPSAPLVRWWPPAGCAW